MSYAVLHLADFALQSVLRTDPALAGKPVALLSDTTKKAIVIEMSATARSAGVEAGFSATQALARCGRLELRPRSVSAEQEAEAVVLAIAGSLAPRVERTAPGVCTIDLRGRSPATNLPHGREALERLQQHGLTASLGLARTPLLALYAARRAVLTQEIVDEKAFLAPLPLALAEPAAELAAILARWGIRTCGGLTAISKNEIGRRLGPEGVALWERAAGETDRPITPVQPPVHFNAGMDLEHEVETLEPLLFILRRFVDRLALELTNAGVVAAELALTLGLVDETAHAHAFRLPEPTANPEIIFRALHTHLETLRTSTAIRRVQLHVTPTRTLTRQHGLFETGLRDPHGFTETLARLGALLGSGRVGTPAIEPTHRPDAFSLGAPRALVEPAPEPAPLSAVGLPLRRFRPAFEASVEMNSAAPAHVRCRLAQGRVLHARGPWKLSGEWWKPEKWMREEWDVELVGGGLYRLAKTAAGWAVEGMYD
jgi:protein ImuB